MSSAASHFFLRKIAIAIGDRDFVPLADPHRVGIGNIGPAIGAESYGRRRVVHDGAAIDDAGGVIVHEAEGVSSFMCGQLSNAGERHFVGLLERRWIVLPNGIKKTLRDQKYLADSQCVEIHVAIDDFSGARISNGAAVCPAASCARNPFDDVVANVHRVDALGQQLHLECVLVSGGGESLIPPAGTFQNGGANWLWNGAVDVINDGLHRFAHRGGGIFLCETEVRDITLDDRLIDGRREIHVADAEKAGARIVGALVESVGGRLDEREVLVHGDGARVGRDLFDPAAGIVSDKSQGGFHVGVFREILGAGKIDRGARGIDVVAALA